MGARLHARPAALCPHIPPSHWRPCCITLPLPAAPSPTLLPLDGNGLASRGFPCHLRHRHCCAMLDCCSVLFIVSPALPALCQPHTQSRPAACLPRCRGTGL